MAEKLGPEKRHSFLHGKDFCDKGQAWPSPIQGQGQGKLDPMAGDMEHKHLMLQRFQEEVN
ncbi:hypothetical protein DCAR_0313335 [Daucus carota subsp. sativus]|uniref:Uncharacterized protein n=1 Tax=Daucus carota subsp. sativus TaxID=79200 RepID=A0A166BYP2_DAUCS|nr:hypothetical protein DCAR_0313335 [Daucus carota subsp. sativus]